ncbi:MAG: hypothetical protein LE180_01675 [Endomicrobium sp.]|nr:hypothetical protein [Endomicrobium sp.]
MLQLDSFTTKETKSLKNFSMTNPCIKIANKANGVSRLHTTVARDMWQEI